MAESHRARRDAAGHPGGGAAYPVPARSRHRRSSPTTMWTCTIWSARLPTTRGSRRLRAAVSSRSPGPGELIVRARTELLRRAVENVIRNAVKYAPAGTVGRCRAGRSRTIPPRAARGVRSRSGHTRQRPAQRVRAVLSRRRRRFPHGLRTRPGHRPPCRGSARWKHPGNQSRRRRAASRDRAPHRRARRNVAPPAQSGRRRHSLHREIHAPDEDDLAALVLHHIVAV